MKFRVAGAAKETGHDLRTTIEAGSAEEAERIAAERGILVSEIIAPEDLLGELANQAPDAPAEERRRMRGSPSLTPPAAAPIQVVGVKLIDVSAGAAFKLGFFIGLGLLFMWLILGLAWLVLALIAAGSVRHR